MTPKTGTGGPEFTVNHSLTITVAFDEASARKLHEALNAVLGVLPVPSQTYQDLVNAGYVDTLVALRTGLAMELPS